MSILDRIDKFTSINGETIAYYNATQASGIKKLTYVQLSDYSDKLAFYLQEKLGDDKTPIVVYGHKSPYMLVCFLACVKSGRAYCPVDISVPKERIKDIVDETKTPFIIATEALDIDYDNILSINDITSIIESTKQKIDRKYYVEDDDVFYIIFTSGSTGKPKGVQITLGCLNNFLRWSQSLLNKELDGRQLTFINQAPFSFDLSVMDLYTSLYLGGTLWCLEKSVQYKYETLLESLKNSKASVWVSTPSFANMCLASNEFNNDLMPEIKSFLFCGETLPNSTADKLLERFPSAEVINTYGPTESTVAITNINVTHSICKDYNPLPVGKPKNGTFIFIIDENGKVLPDGERGEILIVGDSVSIGYFNNTEITNKVFSTREINGVLYRSYRTGDEGYIKDGQLFYCGRIDLQIKLHGYRIEIEDIENNFMKLDLIKNAVVVPIFKDGNVESLTAFVVPNFIVENKLRAQSLIRKKLLEFLPSYMIPKKFIFVDTIPMTTNGKINRKKLLEEI